MDALSISRVMNDDYCARILVWAMETPRTAAEMSASLGIPISACYSRIHHLESLRLLECVERRRSPTGKFISVYSSRLQKATIFMDRGAVRVKIELDDGKVEEMPLIDESDMV
jgi:predicted transcriptional regulator